MTNSSGKTISVGETGADLPPPLTTHQAPPPPKDETKPNLDYFEPVAQLVADVNKRLKNDKNGRLINKRDGQNTERVVNDINTAMGIVRNQLAALLNSAPEEPITILDPNITYIIKRLKNNMIVVERKAPTNNRLAGENWGSVTISPDQIMTQNIVSLRNEYKDNFGRDARYTAGGEIVIKKTVNNGLGWSVDAKTYDTTEIRSAQIDTDFDISAYQCITKINNPGKGPLEIEVQKQLEPTVTEMHY